MSDITQDYLVAPYSRRKKMGIKFKMVVRKKMPRRLRFATVCRKCRKSSTIKGQCISCQIEQALQWGRPY